MCTKINSAVPNPLNSSKFNLLCPSQSPPPPTFSPPQHKKMPVSQLALVLVNRVVMTAIAFLWRLMNCHWEWERNEAYSSLSTRMATRNLEKGRWAVIMFSWREMFDSFCNNYFEIWNKMLHVCSVFDRMMVVISPINMIMIKQIDLSDAYASLLVYVKPSFRLEWRRYYKVLMNVMIKSLFC